MILIQRYIFKELLYNFIFTFVVISLIMLLALSVRMIFNSPLGFLMLIKTIPFMLMKSLSIVIPVTVLVATVMTYGRVAADNEMVTMRASGIHIFRIIVPGILLGLITSLALLVMNDWLVPRAERRIKSLEAGESFLPLLETGLLRGIREIQAGDYRLTWESCKKLEPSGADDRKEDSLRRWRFYGLRAKEYDEAKNLIREIRAESAMIIAGESGIRISLLMKNMEVTEGRGKGAMMGEFTLPLSFGDEDPSRIRLSMRDFSALAAMLERRDKAYPGPLIEAEIHKRIADSFGPLVFVFLSLPVAILFRQQNRMVAFLFAIIIVFFAYYPVTMVGEHLAKKGAFSPALCIWPGAVLLSTAGIFLILRVMKR